MEEVIKCHSSLLVKPLRQTNSASIRSQDGSLSGRRILLRSLSSSGPQATVLALLFTRVAIRSRKELRSKVEARQALRRLNSTLRRFLTLRREAIESNLLLTRLAVSHRQLMVSLSSTPSEWPELVRKTWQSLTRF